jgi:hypothetical protein
MSFKNFQQIPNARKLLCVFLLAIALNHYRTINFLLTDGRYVASAKVLIRSVADASFRSIWISNFATDEKIFEAISSDNLKWPAPRDVTELLQKKLAHQLPSELELVKRRWGQLSGFVHTGASELRDHAKYHAQGYPDEISIRIIAEASLYLSYGACLTANSIPRLDIAVRIFDAADALEQFCELVLSNLKQHRSKLVSSTVN